MILLRSRVSRRRVPSQRRKAHRLGGFQDTQGLIYAAADVQVVDHGILQHAFGIDDEETAQCDAFFFNQHAVGFGHFVGAVCREGILGAHDTVFIQGSVQPGFMRVYGVGGNTENIRSHFEKFFIAVGERQDFGGADEGKVFRIEEEDQPFPL